MRVSSLFLLTALAGCTFTLDRTIAPGEVRGTVLVRGSDGTLDPVKGAHIALGGGLHATSDGSGRFVIRRVPAGRFGLKITADLDGQPGTDAGLVLRNIDVRAGVDVGEGVDLGELTIGKLGKIAGTVTFLDALPAVARAVSGVLGEQPVRDGKFTFEKILPGEYELALLVTSHGANGSIAPKVVQVPGGATATVAFEVSAPALVPDGPIAGIARRIGETTHAGIEVSLVPAGGTDKVVTGAEGRYLWVPVPSDSYTVVAHQTGFLPAALFHVVPSLDLELPDLLLVPSTEPGCGGAPDPSGDSDGDGTKDSDENDVCRCDPDGHEDANEDGLCDHPLPDTDGDGVPDVIDECPGEKGNVRGRGCITDHDGDGFDDDVDNCPTIANADQLNSDDDPAGDACDPTLVVTSPAATFEVTHAFVRFDGRCAPGRPLSVSGNNAGALSAKCLDDGTLDVELALLSTAATYDFELSQTKASGTEVKRSFSGTFTGRIVIVGASGGPATLADALATAQSADIVVLPDGTHAVSQVVVEGKQIAIEGSSPAKVTVALTADLADSTSASAAWFLSAAGANLRLSGMTLDGAGKRVRAGAVRGVGDVEIVDCTIRNIAGGASVGTAVWIEAKGLVRTTRFENIARIGVVASGAAADALAEVVTYVGKGAAANVDYAFVTESGAKLVVRRSTASALLGSDGDFKSSFAVVDDGDLRLEENVVVPVTPQAAAITINPSTTATRALVFVHNAFSGDFAQNYAVFNFATGAIVQAANNWWGAATGPAHATNAAGKGARVSDGVTFTPFLTDGTDASPATPGFQHP